MPVQYSRESELKKALKKLRRFMQEEGNVIIHRGKVVEDILVTDSSFSSPTIDIHYLNGYTYVLYPFDLDSLLGVIDIYKGVHCTIDQI